MPSDAAPKSTFETSSAKWDVGNLFSVLQSRIRYREEVSLHEICQGSQRVVRYDIILEIRS